MQKKQVIDSIIERKVIGWSGAVVAALVATALWSATTSMAQTGTGETDLLGTAWLAEDIGGRGVVDRARSTMEFTNPGQVGGLAGCNRYFGPVSLVGSAISFGNLAATRNRLWDTVRSRWFSSRCLSSSPIRR